jgi:hypothetical protein
MGVNKEMMKIPKSVSYNQDEILYNIIQLYNNGEPFELDPTASILGFYNKSKEFPVPVPRFLYDVNPDPKYSEVKQLENPKKWPFETNSLQSICVDLPFVISCGPSLDIPKEEAKENNVCIISNRFSGFYPAGDMFETYYDFLHEAFRILKPEGICVWKTQRTISGGKTLMTPEVSWMFATQIGFYPIDRFTLCAKARLIGGNIKKWMHSRSYDSQFYVFKKEDRDKRSMKIDYYEFRTKEYKDKNEARKLKWESEEFKEKRKQGFEYRQLVKKVKQAKKDEEKAKFELYENENQPD